MLAARLKDINPDLRLEVLDTYLEADNIAPILDGRKIDYVVDAIDTVSPKLALIRYCMDNHIPVVSSMGAGAKTDITKIRIADISKTFNCPLAFVVRKRLRRMGIRKGLKAVFSEELPDRNAIVGCEEKNKKSKFQFMNEFDKNVLEGYLKSQNQEGIREFIQKLLDGCREEGVDYVNIRILCFDIYMLVVRMLQEKGLHAESAMGMFEEMEEKTEKGVTLSEIERSLIENLTEISASFDTHKKSSGKALIEEIQEYVDSHYSKDISLGSIAGKFYINASYLSQLFKKEMNIKFIDTRHSQVDLKEAYKRMLEEGE